MKPKDRADDDELFASTSRLRSLYQQLPAENLSLALEERTLKEAQRHADSRRRFGSGSWADLLTRPLRYSTAFTLVGIVVGSIATIAIQEISGIDGFGIQGRESVLTKKASSITLKNKVLNDRIQMLEQQVQTIERIIVENVPEKPSRKLTASVDTNSRKSYYIFQVGSYSEQLEAEDIKKQLTSVGYQPKIQRVTVSSQGVDSYIGGTEKIAASLDEKESYRVQIGPFSTLTELESVRQDLDRIKVDALLLEIWL